MEHIHSNINERMWRNVRLTMQPVCPRHLVGFDVCTWHSQWQQPRKRWTATVKVARGGGGGGRVRTPQCDKSHSYNFLSAHGEGIFIRGTRLYWSVHNRLQNRIRPPIGPSSWCVTKNVPYACENFHACAFTRFQKTATAGPGTESVLIDCHITCAASRAWFHAQRPALLQAAVETTGEEESCLSSSSLQRGWSARMATRWSSHRPACSIRYRSPHVSSLANDSFKKFTGACSRRPTPFTLFAR